MFELNQIIDSISYYCEYNLGYFLKYVINLIGTYWQFTCLVNLNSIWSWSSSSFSSIRNRDNFKHSGSDNGNRFVNISHNCYIEIDDSLLNYLFNIISSI